MKKRITGLATIIAIFITLPVITHAATPSDWAVDEVNKAKSSGLVIDSVTENYQAYITREQFCEMVVRAYEKISDNTADEGAMSFDDTNNSEILKAANLGIVSGYGNNLFGPNDLITREQIAAMLVRMIDKAVLYEDIDVYDDNYFADEYEISSWALPAVNFAYDNEIMYGVGGDRIDPQANTTCEQAILLIVRVYDKYNTNIGIIDGDTYYVSDNLYYAEPDEENIENEDGIMFVNNELIIHADPDKTDYDDIEDLIYKFDGEIVGEIALTGTYQIRFDDEYSYDELQNIIANFEKKTFIDWCATNNVFEVEDDYYPNDEEWSDNWGVEAIKAPDAWEYKEYMTPVNVGVYDSVFLDHDDIEYTKRYFNYPNRIQGKDEKTITHGTHVSGIIGAKYDNEIGIAGIVPNVKLYGFSKAGFDDNIKDIKSLIKKTGLNDDVVDLKSSIEYEIALTTLIVLGNCKVINISQNTGALKGFAASRNDKNALNYINENANEIGKYLQNLINIGHKDFLLCIAAGNDNNHFYVKDESKKYGYKEYDPNTSKENDRISGDSYAMYSNFLNAITIPEVQDRIIVVGACKNNGNNKYAYSVFSNVGTRVDVVAPGEGIYSTITNSNYSKKSGTSMAAPYVSGLAAMLFSLDDSLDGADVKQIIKNSANTPVQECSYRMINAEDAIKEIVVNETYWVQDMDGNKLPDVTVNVDDKSNDRKTDLKGAVGLTLTKGDHKIIFSKDGYEQHEEILQNGGAGGYKNKINKIYVLTGKTITLMPIETTEVISIPAKHDPISSGNYIDRNVFVDKYDYAELIDNSVSYDLNFDGMNDNISTDEYTTYSEDIGGNCKRYELIINGRTYHIADMRHGQYDTVFITDIDQTDDYLDIVLVNSYKGKYAEIYRFDGDKLIALTSDANTSYNYFSVWDSYWDAINNNIDTEPDVDLLVADSYSGTIGFMFTCDDETHSYIKKSVLCYIETDEHELMNIADNHNSYTDEYMSGTDAVDQTWNTLQGYWFLESDMFGDGTSLIHSINLKFRSDGTFYYRTWRIKGEGTYTIVDANKIAVNYDVYFNWAGTSTFEFDGTEYKEYYLSENCLIGEEGIFEHRDYYTNTSGDE